MSSDAQFNEALAWIRNSLSAGRLAHAYVIVGNPRGDARDLALSALELIYPAGKGMGTGPATHPDVLWVESRLKSRRISIGQIREIRQRMALTAFAGGCKACVIVGADRLTDEASNAFLKTLEEPIGRSIFLLLTDQPEALLPTVASRCQRITLSRRVEVDLQDTWRARVVELLVRGGSAGGFAAALDQTTELTNLLEEIHKAVRGEVVEAAGEGDGEETVDARVEARHREVRNSIMHMLLLWHRDILMSVCGAGPERFYFKDRAEQIAAGARGVTPAQAIRDIETVETMKQLFDANLKEMPVLNAGFVRLRADR